MYVESTFLLKLLFYFRHNIRFFATGQTKVDKTGNLPAGTVVDTTVVNPYLFDFYLQAHAGLVGTARVSLQRFESITEIIADKSSL